jgi:hypothetical protein
LFTENLKKFLATFKKFNCGYIGIFRKTLLKVAIERRCLFSKINPKLFEFSYASWTSAKKVYFFTTSPPSEAFA